MEATMARNHEESTAAAGEAETKTTETSEVTTAGGTKQRVILTLDEEGAKHHGSEVGATVPRKDFCVKLFEGGMPRGEIAKHLTRLEGRKVAYQIVFQATKGAKDPNPKGETKAEEAKEAAAAEA
jgi:hypothetical protein